MCLLKLEKKIMFIYLTLISDSYECNANNMYEGRLQWNKKRGNIHIILHFWMNKTILNINNFGKLLYNELFT